MDGAKSSVILLTNLPPELQKKYGTRLEEFGADTDDIKEAAQTPEGIKALRKLMRSINNSSKEKDEVAHFAAMPVDPVNPDIPLEDQFAELAANTDIRNLVMDPQAFTRAAKRYYGQRSVQDNTMMTANDGGDIPPQRHLPLAAEHRANGRQA